MEEKDISIRLAEKCIIVIDLKAELINEFMNN